MKKLIVIRRLSQTFFLLVFIYILWSTTYPLKGLLPPETFFRLDPLIVILTSISERIILRGMIFSLAMLSLAAILGRFFCGWICPLGAMIDLAGAAKKARAVENDAVNNRLHPIKVFILAFITAIALSGYQFAWVLDPMVLMARFVSLNLIPTVTLTIDRLFIILIKDLGFAGPVLDIYHNLKSTLLGVKVTYFAHSILILSVFAAVMATTVFLPRFWCRAICPLGAIYSIAARRAPFKRIVDKCTKCKKCKAGCRMGAIKYDISYKKGECILCMDCVYVCPIHSTRFGIK